MVTGTLTGASTMLVVAWLEERHGPGSVDVLFHRLRSGRGHSVARDAFSARSKVSYKLHVDVLEEVAALSNADDDTLRTIGKNGAWNVEHALPGAGLMLKLASPKRLMKHADKLWRTYADFGKVEVMDAANGRARIRISGFDPHPHFCRTLEGFFQGLLERVGAKDIAVREVEHTRDGCVFEGTWR